MQQTDGAASECFHVGIPLDPVSSPIRYNEILGRNETGSDWGGEGVLSYSGMIPTARFTSVYELGRALIRPKVGSGVRNGGAA